MPTMLIYWAKT